MGGPGNSIISQVTGDDAFPFLGSVARSKRRRRVARVLWGGRFDLNDVKGLWKSGKTERGNRSTLATLRAFAFFSSFCYLLIFSF